MNKSKFFFIKNKFTIYNLKTLPLKNLLWYKINNTLFFNFNLKDSNEFTLLQNKWRCIFFNYYKVEISKPRNLIIMPLGKYTKPSYILTYNNINPKLNKINSYKNLNNMYTRIFYEKKNITPAPANSYRLDYITQYKSNLNILHINSFNNYDY